MSRETRLAQLTETVAAAKSLIEHHRIGEAIPLLHRVVVEVFVNAGLPPALSDEAVTSLDVAAFRPTRWSSWVALPYT